MYSIYLSSSAVELSADQDFDLGGARLFCSQFNYKNILETALNLAKHKQLPLLIHVQPEEPVCIAS